MNTAIKMPLRSLNPLVIKDLQDKYPSAVVHIEVNRKMEGQAMDEQSFWDIIALLDWGRKQNEDIIAPAVDALSQFSETEIFQFDQILAEKLHDLDGEHYAKHLGWDTSSDRPFSPDVFLYARCCAVANGKAFYERVLSDPSSLPNDYTFEPILYLAEKAFFLQTGSSQYDFLPSISYETFSNANGWPNRPPLSNVLNGKAA